MRAANETFPGLFRFFLLSLELNCRSKQAIVYGYLVPVLFLVAFGSVFRAATPALLGDMGGDGVCGLRRVAGRLDGGSVGRPSGAVIEGRLAFVLALRGPPQEVREVAGAVLGRHAGEHTGSEPTRNIV